MSLKPILFVILAVGGGAVAFVGMSEDAVPPTSVPGSARIDDEHLTADAMTSAAATDVAARAELVGGESGDLKLPERVDVGLRGRVLGAGGAPAAGAAVTLNFRRNDGDNRGRRGGRGGGNDDESRSPREPLITDAQGLFYFNGRTYRDLRVDLRIEHPAHAPMTAQRQTAADGNAPLHDLGDFRLEIGATVRGRIVAVGGGAGIPDATATLANEGGGRGGRGRGGRFGGAGEQPDDAHEVAVDRNGFFEIAHLTPGNYRVLASAPRHVEVRSDSFELEANEVEELAPIELEAGYQLTGKVFGNDGAPVRRADVQLESSDRRGGATFRGRTDVEGAFAIDHLPGGAMALQVSARGYLDHQQTDVDAARTPVVTVRLFGGLSIRGVVTDALQGEPISRYAVTARRVGDLPDPERAAKVAQLQQSRDQLRTLFEGRGGADAAVSDAQRQQLRDLRDQLSALQDEIGDRGGRGQRGGGRGRGRGQDAEVAEHAGGRFELDGLQEGRYVVDVVAPGYEPAESEPVDLRAGAPAPEQRFRIGRGFTVSGVVRGGDGLPLANARVEVLELAAESSSANDASGRGGRGGGRGGALAEVFRQLSERAGPRGNTVAGASTDDQGRFSIANLATGTVFVRASSDGHATVRTEPFQLSADRADLVLALGGLASLSGTVRGIPAGKQSEVQVTISSGLGGGGRRGGRGGDGTRTVGVDATGHYEVADLEPGDYIVRASIGERGALLRAEFEKLAQGNLVFDVTLVAGQARVHDIELFNPSYGTVTGTVRHNGEPATGFRVSLRAVDANGGAPSGRGRFGRGSSGDVDARGGFEIEEIAPGEYDLQVSGDGQRGETLHRERISVGASTYTVHVQVSTGSLSGTILATPGVDVANIRGSVRLLKDAVAIPADAGAQRGGRGGGGFLRVRDGRFESERLAVGSYLLVLNVGGRAPTTQQIVIAPGKPTRVEIAVGAEQPAPEGAPPPGAGAGVGQGGNGRRGDG